MTRTQDEMRRLFAVERDLAGNLPALPAIFPDGYAPVVRNGRDGARELASMLWGFPALNKPGARPITNVRNTDSPYWRGWLKPEFRCLVPVTSFCEYDERANKRPTWFGLSEERPLFAFAGIWRPWTGERKKENAEHLLYAFLTTEANAVVAPVHPKAMPVLLTGPDEWARWLTAPAEEALALQRPLPDEDLKIVATGQRRDEAAAG